MKLLIFIIPHTLSKSFFSDGTTHPWSLFLFREVSFRSTFSLNLWVIKLLKHLVVLMLCPDLGPWHCSNTCLWNHFPACTSASIPSPQEIPALVHRKPPCLSFHLRPSFLTPRKDRILRETFPKWPWLCPLSRLQPLSPSEWQDHLLMDGMWEYFCFPSISQSLASSRNSISTCMSR